MYLPKLIPYKAKEYSVSRFGGINCNKYCGGGEFANAVNLCSCDHPILSSRPPFYMVDEREIDTDNEIALFYNNGRGELYGKKGSYSVDYNGNKVGKIELPENVHSGNILNFNNKTLFVKKDKRYELDIKSSEIDEFGYGFDIEYVKKGSTKAVKGARLSFVYNDFSEIGKCSSGTSSSDFPLDAVIGDCYHKELEFYRLVAKGNGDEWEYQSSMRLRIDIAQECRKYKVNDYIRLSGLKYWNWAIRGFPDLERFFRIEEIDSLGRYITEPINTFSDMVAILFQKNFPSNDIGYDDPVINNAGNDLYLLEGNVSAVMPDMDFICAGANRVWGCSNENREIYACELGNSRNWSVFEGISSDSYAVSIASPGNFTAAISYLGSPIFFKEDEMIVINGSRPASFQVCSYSYRGVSADSPGGVCVVNDILYYKSYDGIFAYSGSKPVCVSDGIGDEIKNMSGVLMSGEGDHLFVSGMQGEDSVHYAYDTNLDIWHKYDGEKTFGYLKYSDATLEVRQNKGKLATFSLYKGVPYELKGNSKQLQEQAWSWESGDIYYSTPKRKYVGRITLDTECSEYSDLFISYNGETFKSIGHFPPHKRGMKVINIFAQRCDYFRLKMTGKGSFSLYNITSEIEEAAENG